MNIAPILFYVVWISCILGTITLYLRYNQIKKNIHRKRGVHIIRPSMINGTFFVYMGVILLNSSIGFGTLLILIKLFDQNKNVFFIASHYVSILSLVGSITLILLLILNTLYLIFILSPVLLTRFIVEFTSSKLVLQTRFRNKTLARIDFTTPFFYEVGTSIYGQDFTLSQGTQLHLFFQHNTAIAITHDVKKNATTPKKTKDFLLSTLLSNSTTVYQIVIRDDTQFSIDALIQHAKKKSQKRATSTSPKHCKK